MFLEPFCESWIEAVEVSPRGIDLSFSLEDDCPLVEDVCSVFSEQDRRDDPVTELCEDETALQGEAFSTGVLDGVAHVAR